MCGTWAGARWISGWAPLNILICAKLMSILVEKSLGKLNIKQCVYAWKHGLSCPGLMVKAVALGLGFRVLRQAGFLSDPLREVITLEPYLLGSLMGPKNGGPSEGNWLGRLDQGFSKGSSNSRGRAWPAPFPGRLRSVQPGRPVWE